MKPITLPMAELKPALTGLGKLIQKFHGLPVLKSIKIERTAEGWVSLTATDLDAFATVRLAERARPGARPAEAMGGQVFGDVVGLATTGWKATLSGS
jgi:hypothetical protein